VAFSASATPKSLIQHPLDIGLIFPFGPRVARPKWEELHSARRARGMQFFTYRFLGHPVLE
jgi:hypothetical protein